jgi:hypothetical protein
MKKTGLTGYENELKKIERERAKIQDLTKEYDFKAGACERLSNVETDAERETILNDLKKERAERDAIRQENEKINIKIKCLQHNAILTFTREIIPIISEVLKPYYNKPLGEKTRAKIRDELKARYNIAFYFKDAREMVFVFLNDAGYSYGASISVYASYTTPFLTDNKINDLSTVNIHTYKRPYIENVDKHVKALYKAYDDAKKAYDDFCIKAGIYTGLSVDGLKDIDKYNPKFNGII